MAIRSLAGMLFVVLGLGASSLWAGPQQDPQAVAQSMLHALDYVAVDYPRVVQGGKVGDAAEYAEQQEFVAQVQALVVQLPSNPARAPLEARIGDLVAAVASRAPGERVSALCAELAAGLISAYHVAVVPARAPEPEAAAALYQSQCATCHGLHGHGDGPLAAGLQPRPADFHDRERQSQRSLYGLFGTISLGVEGTAMPAFTQLSEDQRWALAFYVGSFYATAAERAAGKAAWEAGKGRELFGGLAQLTQATPAALGASHGDLAAEVLAYLRTEPSRLDRGRPSPLAFSRDTLRRSLAAYRDGDPQQAYRLAVTAYLEGFELAEAGLSTVDPDLKSLIERKMGAFRQSIKQGVSAADLARADAEIELLLKQADERLSSTTLSPLMGFASAFVILLREGLEAILVLAAIAAFLLKTGRRDAMRYMHAGWLAALGLGLLTWLAAKHLIVISGASRELTEGFTALFAAAMLIYVGFWLHNHTHAQRWKGFIQGRLKETVSKGTMWSLISISFIAVYREMLETVLFYETLWLQTRPGGHGALVGGLAAAAVSLVLIAWAIFRFSVKLPLRLFFQVNAALIFSLAVIFAGKGIAALQEAGKLAIYPIGIPTIDVLGIYPTLQSVGLQLAIVAVTVGWLGWRRMQDRASLAQSRPA